MKRPSARAVCLVALLMVPPLWVAAQDGAANGNAAGMEPPGAVPAGDVSADVSGQPEAGADRDAAGDSGHQPEAVADQLDQPANDADTGATDEVVTDADEAATEPGGPPALQPEASEGTVVPSAGGALPDSPVLTINEAALYAGSAWGRRVQADLERLSRELAAENDRIYDELAAQEDELTTLRATLPPAEFRERAEAFDAHAQAVRAERQAAVRSLNDIADTERQNFFSVSVPVFAEVMTERGATVILDQRMVFVSADAVDVTTTLIARIDAEIGPGPAAQPDTPPGAVNQGKAQPAP